MSRSTTKKQPMDPAAKAVERPRLSQATARKLARLGIHRPADLLLHLPLRYEDETRLFLIEEAPSGQPVVVEGEVVEAQVQYRPRRQLICQIRDASGVVYMRMFNFYGSQLKTLCQGARIRLFGELRPGFFGAEMIHPRYRILKGDQPLPDALTPVYSTTAGLSQDMLRALIRRHGLERALPDTLPAALLKKLALPDFEDSVRYLHAPPPQADLEALALRTHPAWRRVKFDELLAQQLSLRLHHARRRNLGAPQQKFHGQLEKKLLDSLPFRLTGAQRRVADEIRADLDRAYPMQRLLQGDVGSGKTIVAALACLQVVENGFQVAVIAPTEILAEQTFNKFSTWLEPLGVKVVWLASRLSSPRKRAALGEIARGGAPVAIGTHALFQRQVKFQNLALAVVDEQHRFGVAQRLAVRAKGDHPHQLMMSATPIPRTLSMSYFADLEVSVIDELPPGRTPVVTKLVADTRRQEVVGRVREACQSGKQVYWVCPLIEESEALQLKTAVETHATLSQTFPELQAGLLHGKLTNPEKTRIMQRFKSGELNLLVATTVVEVGVDVPNASLMVIEHAERLGLSQLHQLRGRVGRGAVQSVCILFYQTPLSDSARARLKIIYENTDGFEIARRDLAMRGPGEFLGERQSGIPLLKVADILQDQKLLEQAMQVAPWLLEHHPDHVERHLERWLGATRDFLAV
jgi:ATP-dependent DNA helicase RecG